MIVHLDADAFFASVEQVLDPGLLGLAMAVGGERRGIIASASYEARACGVYTPMPTVQARKICPQLVVVRGKFSEYRRFSHRMFAFADDYTPHVERTSIDEGYLDLSSNKEVSATAAAKAMQRSIREELGITVSFGIGSNKLIAQIASKLRKPAGLVEVPAGEEGRFIAPLRNHWLPGVGPQFAAKLDAIGLSFVHQIATAPVGVLARAAGPYAHALREFAHGRDHSIVLADREDAKSYGCQETFSRDVADREYLLHVLHAMADDLMRKVRRDRRAIRTVTVRVRHTDWQTATRGTSVREPTSLENDVYPLLAPLLGNAWSRRQAVRLVGLRFSNITPGLWQDELDLDVGARKRSNQVRAAAAIDQLLDRSLSIMRGHSLCRDEPPSRSRGTNDPLGGQ